MFRSRHNQFEVADTPVERTIRGIAGYGVGSQLRLPIEPMSSEDFGELIGVAARHRMIGAVAECVASGDLPVTQDQRLTLTAHHSDWSRHAVHIERALVSVGGCFVDAGIQFRVLKGAALSHLVYDDPAWRIFSDLDVLVPSHQFEDAVRVVRAELNAAQWIPELRRGFDREFGKESLLGVDGVELDLHRTFVTGPFGLTIELDDLFQTQTPFEVGGQSFPALDDDSLFLHSAYNVALGDYPVRLSAVRDMLLVYERRGIRNSTIVETARAWRATAVIQRAAALAMHTLELPLGHELEELARLTVSRRDSWLMASYLTSARSYTRPLASLAVIDGVRPRIRYARALLAPSADYLHSRGLTERGHLRRAQDRLFRRG
jgi:hypothetical protein